MGQMILRIEQAVMDVKGRERRSPTRSLPGIAKKIGAWCDEAHIHKPVRFLTLVSVRNTFCSLEVCP